MNSLLVPMLSADQPRGVYARSPLANDLRKLVSTPVTLMFGDNDWLYHPGTCLEMPRSRSMQALNEEQELTALAPPNAVQPSHR